MLVVLVAFLLLGWTLPAAAAGGSGAGVSEARWRLADPLPGRYVTDLSFIDEDQGWACTSDGTVAKTTNGATTWSAVSTGGWALQDVDFVDSSTGWTVAFWGGGILKTTDGGATWNVQHSDPSQHFLALEAIDSDHAWACGDGIVVSTSDGGATWSQHDLGAGYCTSVAFGDADHGWIADGQSLRKTTDGGRTWQVLNAGEPMMYPSEVSSPSRDVVVVASYDVVAFSSDGGATWKSFVRTSTYYSFNAVSAVDVNYAWCVTNDGEVWVTGNGGADWDRQTVEVDPYGTGFFSVQVRGRRGYAAGDGLLVAESSGLGGDVRSPTTTVSPSPDPYVKTIPLNAETTFTFTPHDDRSGSIWTYFRIDEGVWQPGLVYLAAAPADHSNDGPHTLDVCSVDGAGNEEVGNTTAFFVDTKAPGLTVEPREDDMIGFWINHRSVVDLAYEDPAPSSGVAGRYSVDGRSLRWAGPTIILEAPATHSNDGRHKVRVLAQDAAGNVGGDQTFAVAIDTRKPAPSIVAPVTARRGATARVAFKITDAKPCAGVGAVGIVIVRSSGRVAAQYDPGRWYRVGRSASFSFACRLAKGKYRLLVYAGDGAGNINKKPAVSSLTVR